MAEQPPAVSTGAGPSKPPRPPNPVWRMMGLPNFRFKLPSRNWMIFWTITGTWTAAVVYDRQQKKRIQRKWAKVVEHIAQEPLDVHQLPRRLTIYLGAPPADGLTPAREHFNEYIKPILVSAALDWDAIEGRREGDVRAGLAERIRKLRRKQGEQSNDAVDPETEDVIELARASVGVKAWPGTAGDIVVGRHTWKEYVRGLHEGWLGPINPAPEPVTLSPEIVPVAVTPESPVTAPAETASPNRDNTSPTAPEETASPNTDDASPTATTVVHESKEPGKKEPEIAAEEDKKPKRKKQLPPFNSTADYTNSQLSPNCPNELPPSTAIPFPHLLGFWNFPIRMYRFLNQRKVAEEVGRQTAAAVLATYEPYGAPGEKQISSEEDYGSHWEQELLLKHEELEWHKSVRERKDDEGKERVWLDDMVVDPRIGERMRKFILDMEAEARFKRVLSEKGDSWWSSIWPGKQEKKEEE